MHSRGLALLLALLVPCAAACDGGEPINVAPQPSGSPSAAPAPGPSTSASAEPVKPSIYPATAKRPVVDEYHGVKVTDDYRWLEDPNNPEVKTWIGEQHKRARAYLDAAPGRAILRDKIKGILSSTSADRFAIITIKDRVFAMKAQPPKQQDFLVVMTAPDKAKTEADLKERVLVDPNTLDPKGRTTIDWYVPSPDGKLVAVSMSVGGSESGTVHVYDVEKGTEQGDIVPSANSGTAGGSLSWAGDSKGFYYTRHPHKGEVKDEDLGFFQQVYFHKLGTKDSEDKLSTGKELPRIAENELETSKDGKWVVDNVQNGDGGEYWHFLLDTKTGKWTRFADLPDKIVHAAFGLDNKLYLISVKDAPRGKVLRLDPAKPDLAKAELLVPHSDVTIQGFTATKSKLYVKDLVGGPSQVRIFDLKGKDLGKMPIPAVSSVRAMVPIGGDDDLLFRNSSYTEPPAWYAYRAKLKEPVAKTVMAMTSNVSFADTEAVRETCTSKDGTKVPINILRKKGTKLDGSNPAVLTGYGGYGISLQPGNNPLLHVWLDLGGVFAIANLRGGGEFGEDWHRAGNLTKKQNVFDDFYGCAKYLVETKHTSPQKLAIEGGSNGGLLMGAALVQHPEMYKAVVSFVGIYDMLRVETTPNGAFNVTEFGTVKDADLFKALYAYSPYHNVKDGTAYPSVMFLTGANDPRVEPYNSRKMTARLQAATSGGVVMLRVNENTGHGIGTPLEDEIDEQADVYAFLAKELGIQVK